MENQEYLNQIAAKSAPKRPSTGGSKFDISSIIHSKAFLFGAIAFGVLILIMILGAALGSGKKKTDIKTELVKYQLHIDNTSEVINAYQPNVKSSTLRSYSASLNSLLSNMSSDIGGYLKTKYNYKAGKEEKKLAEKAYATREELEEELFAAKINGNLDRIYTHKMAFEISQFLNEEAAISKIAKDDTLVSLLAQPVPSLKNLYDNFNDFSEAK